MSSSFRRAAPRRKLQGNVNSTTTPTLLTSSLDGISSGNSSISPHTVLERIGTKPSKGGLTLTSSGLRELDAIIGGGQPLGTAILVEEDRWTQDLALSLARYWCAEAVCQGQNLSLVATGPLLDISNLSLSGESDFLLQQHGMNVSVLESFISLLPKNLHFEKARNKEKTSIAHSSASNQATIGNTQEDFTIIEENEEDFEEEGENERIDGSNERDEEILQNAWQYKLSVQRERRAEHTSSSKSSGSSTSKVFCHSYDLSGKLEGQLPDSWKEQRDLISILDCSKGADLPSNPQSITSIGVELFKKCVKHINAILNAKPNGVVRMMIMNAPVNTTALALPLLLSHIRTHSLPVVLFVTVRPWILSKESSQLQSLIALRRTCDAVFTCEGFDAVVTPPPSEFSDLAGIFSIRKTALQSLSHFADSTTNRRPPANRYGMKRDRRKLHIRMLHLPPEDFSAGGSSVGSGVRSGGGRPNQKENNSKGRTTALQPGMGCASNMPGKNSSLDF